MIQHFVSHAAVNGWAYQADEHGNSVLAFWRWTEKLNLVRPGCHIQLTGNAECLQIRESRIAELLDDGLLKGLAMLRQCRLGSYLFLSLLVLCFGKGAFADLVDGSVQFLLGYQRRIRHETHQHAFQILSVLLLMGQVDREEDIPGLPYGPVPSLS